MGSNANGPGRRPGARKPGRKPKVSDAQMMMEIRAKQQARIQREVAKYDFARRAVELRRLNKPYGEIAQMMSAERREVIHEGRVRAAVLKQLRNVDALDDVRYAELDKLESMAARLRTRLDEMDELPVVLVDVEVYTKVADSYLKYRERIAKLVGLDAPVRQKIERDSGSAPGQPLGGNVHIGADGAISITMGSVNAYEEWVQLSEKGLVELASQVLELEEGETEEVGVGLHAQDAAGTMKAGVTLRPDIEVIPGAERQHQSALDALAALNEPEE